MADKVAAILLAAGRSSRMGCCKQLLPLAGGTVIGRCLETLAGGGAAEIVVVVSITGEEVAVAAAAYQARVAVNPDENGDMASSIRAGIASLTMNPSGVIVALADYPLVQPATIAELIRSHGEFPELIIIPLHEGRQGHPLLFPRLILDELQEELTLRDLVRVDEGRVKRTVVVDQGILIDMDTPADYQRIIASLQR